MFHSPLFSNINRCKAISTTYKGVVILAIFVRFCDSHQDNAYFICVAAVTLCYASNSSLKIETLFQQSFIYTMHNLYVSLV